MTAPMTFDLETEVRELFAAKMREFAAFCAENWTMTTEEAEALMDATVSPMEYAKGFTAAMTDGLSGALEHWLDEELGYSR
jgi:hypothetical protein